jgi:hypothetical protein
MPATRDQPHRDDEESDRVASSPFIIFLSAVADPRLPGAEWREPCPLRNCGLAAAAFVKSFGRREAYESLRGTNPRAADEGLWVFLFSAERGEVTTGGGSFGR